ncbi:hypothetical protein HRbin40_01240 [bacterium HR40]|nr:hypothetical protein HRbin40_01240 [bacterium HR40]
MSETRIRARLPQLDLELQIGRDEARGSEWLMLSLRAVPSFVEAAQLFDPFAWWQAAVALNPWLAWPWSAMRLPAPAWTLAPRQDEAGEEDIRLLRA